jgi:hypothetical protein
MKSVTGDLGAFRMRLDLRDETVVDGPLTDLTFAVKDIFDVAGLVTGGGVAWQRRGILTARRTHDRPERGVSATTLLRPCAKTHQANRIDLPIRCKVKSRPRGSVPRRKEAKCSILTPLSRL